MIPDATIEPAAPSKLRLRFSLLALLIFITLVCVPLAWLVQPRRVVATALFQVSSQRPSLVGDRASTPADPQEFATFKQTQIAFLESNFVLNAAVRQPGIASLAILANRDDPAAWLQEHLEVDFPQQGEIMSISLRGPEEYAQELVSIVDAVAKAYSDEVIYVERQRNQAIRDLIARTVNDLNQEISRKLQALLGISQDGGALLPEVDLKRLDRVDAELMRMEMEQLEASEGEETSRLQVLEKRMARLREQQKKLEERVRLNSHESVELSTRRRELEHLKRMSDELSLKLEKLDIEANAPARIRQVQQAAVMPE